MTNEVNSGAIVVGIRLSDIRLTRGDKGVIATPMGLSGLTMSASGCLGAAIETNASTRLPAPKARLNSKHDSGKHRGA